jgi:hypothetical protein
MPISSTAHAWRIAVLGESFDPTEDGSFPNREYLSGRLDWE